MLLCVRGCGADGGSRGREEASTQNRRHAAKALASKRPPRSRTARPRKGASAAHAPGARRALAPALLLAAGAASGDSRRQGGAGAAAPTPLMLALSASCGSCCACCWRAAPRPRVPAPRHPACCAMCRLLARVKEVGCKPAGGCCCLRRRRRRRRRRALLLSQLPRMCAHAASQLPPPGPFRSPCPQPLPKNMRQRSLGAPPHHTCGGAGEEHGGGRGR